jgi:hypothetical protein
MEILEAAKHDPLRAQEIEAGINKVWWQRWEVYQRETVKIAKSDERKRRR